MGIPSYFSYIIKNYPNIIRNLKHFSLFQNGNNIDSKLQKQQNDIDHLYMDCNSIIYDAVRSIEYSSVNSNYESELIDKVIDKIHEYILIIKPNKSVFIAFDGVAPLAKMVQQRTRRYKSDFMSKIADINKPVESWNTSSITPGTEFMEMLSKKVDYAFKFTETKYNVEKIYVSCSNSAGEGEHKLMEHIRNTNHENSQIAIYGLDSDLIMLSLFHLDYCKNIYVFREAPEFIKSSIPTNIISNDSDLYFLDIRMLSESIVKEMNCKYSDIQRTYDYVFMCFFLGNDFLPHFPAMNIRTHGINVLMDIYKRLLGVHPDKFFISKDKRIQWKNVGIFIHEIAKDEHQYLINEYFVREKWDKRQFSDSTPEDREELIQNIPMIYRQEEKYISPSEYGWEKRYYNMLFHKKPDQKKICVNYIEGLEWVLKYYTKGCPDWKWKYHYHYPPLFADLHKYIPHFEMDFIKPKENNQPFTPELQLAFVLPLSQLKLLPKRINDFLMNHYDKYYPSNYKLQWAFCRYFWESHPILPSISLELLEQWNTQFSLAMKR